MDIILTKGGLTMNNLITTAREYIGNNLSVIPTRENKAPAIAKWSTFMQRKMVNGEVERFFSTQRAKGIGIICGQVSGNLEVIDIDTKNDPTGTLAKEFSTAVQDAMPELFDRLVVSRTIHNGLHLYYRCSSIEGNQKLATNKDKNVLIETRGEGGYVIAPPSDGYRLVAKDFISIPTISVEERQHLLAIAKSFDQTNNEISEDEDTSHDVETELSTFDDYNLRGDSIELLKKHGWIVVMEKSHRIYFKRPGNTDNLVSANWHKEKRIFYPFTTSTLFTAGKGYNPTMVYAMLECDNDFSIASHKLYHEGFGARITNHNKHIDLPTLPIDRFPEFIQRFINTCENVYKTPIDFWVGSMLTATALAIGDKLELVTKYRNVPIFWTCLIGNVSIGKTEPQSICMAPFVKLDEKEITKYNIEKAKHERIKALTQTQRNAEGIGDNNPPPKCFQYLLIDFTPEALTQVHSVNKRGLMIHRDELIGWIDDFGRYNKSGEQTNMLSSWTRIAMKGNRVSKDPLMVSLPVIMVMGGMQPEVLKRLAVDDRSENGFLSRMVFFYPKHTSKPTYSNAIVPEELLVEWEHFIVSLTQMVQKTELRLTQEAEGIYIEWYNKNVGIINNEKSGYLIGVYGKLDVIALRLAVVIKGMFWQLDSDQTPTISGEIMKTALEITEYFRATALKVYHKIFTNQQDELSKKEVAIFLFKNLGYNNKTHMAEILKTSRTQVQRWLREK